MGQLVKRGFDSEEALKASRGLLSLSEARRVKAFLSGCVKPLVAHSNTNGRIHPSWKFDTATGRLTCSSPNLQNLPGVGQDKYRVRDTICSSPGQTFITADYSQLELRIL